MSIAELPAAQPVVDVPRTAYTLDGFRAWARSDDFPERGRITFIDGRLIIDMRPERIESHIKVKGEIYGALFAVIKKLDLGVVYQDGAMLSNLGAHVGNEPDAMFATWETLVSGKLTPLQDLPQDGLHKEMVGTADWVCEVVSNSSVKKDTIELREKYHQAGIREYWLIDARAEDEQIDFELLIWQPDDYVAAPQRDGWVRSPVFDCEFQLTRHRDRVGGWQYDLKHRDLNPEP